MILHMNNLNKQLNKVYKKSKMMKAMNQVHMSVVVVVPNQD